MNEAQFRHRFKYKKDAFPDFRILDREPWAGDCKDYATTMAWLVAGKSRWKMWRNILTFRSIFWVVLSNGRNRFHMVLWHRGKGYTDNIADYWGRRTPHRRLFPANIVPVGLMIYGAMWLDSIWRTL